jgi:hypothetical protein
MLGQPEKQLIEAIAVEDLNELTALNKLKGRQSQIPSLVPANRP